MAVSLVLDRVFPRRGRSGGPPSISTVPADPPVTTAPVVPSVSIVPAVPPAVMAEPGFTSLVGKITKLKGVLNYRTWTKDMEMCFLRNQWWTVVSSPVPAAADQNVTWVTRDNWARGEIHLCCEAEVQEVIISSEHAYDS